MKKTIILLSASLISLQASDSLSLKEYQDHSLIAIEGGAANLTLNKTTQPSENLNQKPLYGAFKIGAQSENYRIYLAGRYYNISDFDFANSLGVALQYLQPLNNTFGFYFGVNSGLMNLKFDSDEGKREFSSNYFGLDFGVDLDVTELIAFQIGSRFININDINTRLNSTKTQEVDYSLDNMLHLYMTLVFKFNLH